MEDEMNDFNPSSGDEEDGPRGRYYHLHDDAVNFSHVEWNGHGKSHADFNWAPFPAAYDNRVELIGDIGLLPNRTISDLHVLLPSSQQMYRIMGRVIAEQQHAFWQNSCQKLQQAMAHQNLNEIIVRLHDPSGPHDFHLSTLLEHLPSQLPQLRLVIVKRGRDPPTTGEFDLVQSFRTLKQCQSLQYLFLNDSNILDENSCQMFANALKEGLPNLKELTIFAGSCTQKECVVDAIRTKPSLHTVEVHAAYLDDIQISPETQSALQTFPRINAALGNKSIGWADPERLKELVEAMISVREDFVTFHYILHTIYDNGSYADLLKLTPVDDDDEERVDRPSKRLKVD